MNTTALLQDILFANPDLTLYAILDGACIPGLLDQFDALTPEYVCLYRGELKDGIDQVAPYLVELAPDHLFTKWLLENGWGKHFGVFLLSAEPLPVIRLHLRRSLRVYTEDGRGLLFRYYDPRVLRVFMPTMNAEEAKTFFGPIQEFLLEGEQAKDVLRFLIRDGKVVKQTREVAGSDGWN